MCVFMCLYMFYMFILVKIYMEGQNLYMSVLLLDKYKNDYPRGPQQSLKEEPNVVEVVVVFKMFQVSFQDKWSHVGDIVRTFKLNYGA